MAIPLKKERSKDLEREIRRLTRQKTGATKRVRKLLCKARIYAIEHENGNTSAYDDLETLVDMAHDAGLDPTSLKMGPGMANKIAALLDLPESQAHAAGLLFAAADLVAAVDAAKSAELTAMAESLSSLNDAATWRDIATPRIAIPVRVV